MEIIEYKSCKNRDVYLNQIKNYEWRAAKFLAVLLKEDRLHEALGGWYKLFMLVDGDRLVSFITFSERDCIAGEPVLTPWLGFFHTAPEYRGRRLGKLLIDHACQVARANGYDTVYIATDHVDLYEKYGFSYIENRIDVWGEDSRVYQKRFD